jgi:hypothetical protein
MPAHRLLAVAALAATTVLATGCAGAQSNSAKGFTGRDKAVATTIDDLQSAGRKGDQAKICDQLLSAGLVAQIKRTRSTSCATAVDDVLKDVDSYDIKVKSVRVIGQSATAGVESSDKNGKRPDTLSLVFEQGRWKISALGR